MGLKIFAKLRLIFSWGEFVGYKALKKCLGQDAALRVFLYCLNETAVRILKSEGAKIGANADLNTPVIFHNVRKFSAFMLGDNVHIGKNCFFDLAENITIGSNTTVSMNCTFITHTDTGKTIWQITNPRSKAAIIIGSNVYLGANCSVLQGCKIADEVFLGANSLVTKNIENAGLYIGQPVKLVERPKNPSSL